MSSLQGVGEAKNVGAPTFLEWDAGAHTRRIPVVQAVRTEVFLSRATFAHGTEIPARDSVVTAAPKTLTPVRGELQKSRHAPRVRIMVKLRKNVGAPTFLDSPRVVCP